jgi:methionyl-tRNA formyltransferase
MKNLSVLFWGTPEFAVATLGSLLMNGFNVVGVVTVPDKPAGRGRKPKKSAVKEFAEMNYLPVFQPYNLSDPEFIKTLEQLNADIFVVVAFKKLPGIIWKMPPSGTINLHASLLPHYRGAAPINHAIINGETTTGVTTFYIDEKLDNGNLLLREEIQIFPFENAGDLHDRLMKHGARLVIQTLEGIADNTITPLSQDSFLKPGEIIMQAPRIFPDDCLIDWNNPPRTIHNLIRGLSPGPCARTIFRKGNTSFSVKIFESQCENVSHKYNPGSVVSDGKLFLKIACTGGFISILNLQLEGKKRMNIAEFLRGFQISDYTAASN